MKKPLSLLLSLFILLPMSQSLAKGTDIITMNNGDIHNGIVDNKAFKLRTLFGEIVIPYNHMDELHLSSTPYQDKLLTESGDRFIGDILDLEITILRTLDPAIPVSLEDISHINFSNKNVHQKSNETAEIISTRYGDLFSAGILLESVKIQTPDKFITIAKNNIHTIDIDKLIDDEETKIQLRTLDKQTIQGVLEIKNISLKTKYQQTLTLNADILNSITFNLENKKPSKYIPIKSRLNASKENTFSYMRDELSDKSLGPELVILNSASYIRGDNNGDDDEKPAMPVTLKAFAIGTHEITFDQYDQFCNDTRRDKPNDEEWGRGSRPVVNVSWKDATAYTQWLSRRSGKTYRLPTDAEWEYAARAGSETSYWWGNESGVAMANCEGCNSIWSGEKTAPVARFPANEFGLYDTAGNVFEWVTDCYHNTFEHAPKDGAAIDKPGCGKRVIRGGAWSFPAKESRSANRWRDFPTRRSDDTGFRVVRELD